MSEKRFLISTGNKGFIEGYTDDPRNASVNQLCPPSANGYVTKQGDFVSRGGMEDSSWDLSEGNNPATAFNLDRFNITFFAADTKVYYIDHNASDAVVDTGITLTTGTTSRFEEYAGTVFVGNRTDGWYGIMVTRLNGAVSGGASTIVTDVDGASRSSALDTELSPGTKNLRIGGTNEQYSSITVNTGTFTLSGTASQAYTDDTVAIVVYDLTSRYPKCSKIVNWREGNHFINMDEQDQTLSSDATPSTLGFTDSATAATYEAITRIWN